MKKIGLILLIGAASISRAGYSNGNHSECVYQQDLCQNGYHQQNQFALTNEDRNQQNGVTTKESSEQDQKLAKQIQDSLQSFFSNKYKNVIVYIYKSYVTLQSFFPDKYSNVIVQVRNGNVTLQGIVATQEDKNSLEQEVRKISGVKNVINKVTVENIS